MATTTKKVSVTSTSDASLLKSTGFDNYTWTEAKTAGVNTFVVDKATKVGTLSLTGTGDTVKIDGYSGDFTASISGAKLTLASSTQTLTVTLAKASQLNLNFTDGNKVVDYAAKTLGTQLLTKTALPIYGVTAHEVAALSTAATAATADKATAITAAKVAALTDTAGHVYTSVDTAITSNDTAVSTAAIQSALAGTTFTSVADLLTAYNAFANPTFSIVAGTSAAEGSSAIFTVNLSSPQAVATSVNIGLTGVGGATQGVDYNPNGNVSGTGISASGSTLTFAAGATTATLKFPILTDTTSPESGEGMTLALTAVANSVAKVNATGASGTVSIIDVPAIITNLSATNVTAAGVSGVDTFNVASGTYTATVSNFAAGDKLHFFSGASITVLPDADQTDGIQQISAADPATGATATIVLTGLTATQDSGVFNVDSFNTVFGTGAIA